jgi:anti-anti-sigma regulatory factor
MSFHFCSRSWEVRDVEDGTLVKLTARDLDKQTVGVLVDDLLELVLESGRPILYLDFSEIQTLPSVVVGKLLALNTRLTEHGGRVVMTRVDSHVYGICQATSLTEVLDIRPDALVGSVG